MLRCAGFMTRKASLGVFLLLLPLVALACRRSEPQRIDLVAVERCESGVTRAVEAPTRTDGSHIYHDACKDIYAEKGCRDAFGAAASADPDQAVLVTMDACRKAYCPILPNSAEFEACQPTFQLSLQSALHGWPPLHHAIVTHDAKDLSPRVLAALFRFYARGTQPWPRGGPAGSAGSAAPGPSEGASAASAAPPPSAASAAPALSSAPSAGSAAPRAKSAASAARAPRSAPSH